MFWEQHVLYKIKNLTVSVLLLQQLARDIIQSYPHVQSFSISVRTM